ncbi:MAG: flagellar assembly protein FliW [Pirellulales bacterium]
MEIRTSRFGSVEIAPGDVIQFPTGLPGLDDCTAWVLLADSQNDALGWLQSTTHPEVALAVVSPRRFVPDYRLRVTRGELGSLLSQLIDDVHVLAIVGKNDRGITLNLKAPLVIHLGERIGRQVVSSGDQSVQYELCREASVRKKIA